MRDMLYVFGYRKLNGKDALNGPYSLFTNGDHPWKILDLAMRHLRNLELA